MIPVANALKFILVQFYNFEENKNIKEIKNIKNYYV